MSSNVIKKTHSFTKARWVSSVISCSTLEMTYRSDSTGLVVFGES